MELKKREHKELEATHIHDLWETDLSNFLEVLSLHEEAEDRDRQLKQSTKAGRLPPKRTGV